MQSDVFGSTEPSRFLTQIREELVSDRVKMIEHVHQSPLIRDIDRLTQIQNTEDLRNRIKKKLEKGISPSGLNTFLRCPMDFYFKQILGLREVNEVEEEVQNNTFGSIVHKVLEDFYDEVVGTKLTTAHIDKWRIL